MLGLLGVLIIGLIVGAIAKLIVPGKEPGGCLVTSAIGVAGSFVAFYLGTLLGWTSGNPDSLRPVGFIPSLIGAVILLLVLSFDPPAIRALNATSLRSGTKLDARAVGVGIVAATRMAISGRFAGSSRAPAPTVPLWGALLAKPGGAGRCERWWHKAEAETR